MVGTNKLILPLASNLESAAAIIESINLAMAPVNSSVQMYKLLSLFHVVSVMVPVFMEKIF